MFPVYLHGRKIKVELYLRTFVIYFLVINKIKNRFEYHATGTERSL
jgi:hypothetical protein